MCEIDETDKTNKDFPLCDAHLHIGRILDFEDVGGAIKSFSGEYLFSSCAHTKDEWDKESKYDCVKAFGLHPQSFVEKGPGYFYENNLHLLESLLEKGALSAIGEAGFDLFTKDFQATLPQQKVAWEVQLDLAIKYNIPLIIHERKGLNLIYCDIKKINKVPAVLFHSFFGNEVEAKKVLARCPRAYFSFGGQIMRGNKKATGCVRKIPLDHLLLETDAPFQTQKGEVWTKINTIKKVYRAAYDLRLLDTPDLDFCDFCAALKSNFQRLFNLAPLEPKLVLQNAESQVPCLPGGGQEFHSSVHLGQRH